MKYRIKQCVFKLRHLYANKIKGLIHKYRLTEKLNSQPFKSVTDTVILVDDDISNILVSVVSGKDITIDSTISLKARVKLLHEIITRANQIEHCEHEFIIYEMDREDKSFIIKYVCNGISTTDRYEFVLTERCECFSVPNIGLTLLIDLYAELAKELADECHIYIADDIKERLRKKCTFINDV